MTYFVLEQRPQRLDEAELEVLGQAADVVVALDVRGTFTAAGLDDVWIERALDQELHRFTGGCHDFAFRSLKGANEFAADDLSLGLWISHPSEVAQERLARINDFQVHTRGLDIVAFDLLGLPLAKQPVIDEDGSQLVTDCSLHQRGRYRRVDAA